MTGQFSIPANSLVNPKSLKEDHNKRYIVFFEPWEIAHWKLSSKYAKSIDGVSVIDAARWIFKRLVMLEDTALLYVLSRSPGRYIFYVDMGDIPPAEKNSLLRKVKQSYKKKTLLNPATGQLEFRNNPMTPEEDIFIATSGGKESTRVEILSGPEWNSMDTVEYFRDKMFSAIKIPRAYFGGDADASQGLAQRDVRFARTCLRIQREVRNGIRHIARVHMASLGMDPDSTEWDTRMTAPSSILELQQIETMNAQAGLISALENKLPLEWMLQRIMHLSQDDAATVMLKKASETEQTMDDQARIAYDLQKKYPGVDVNALGGQGGQPGAPQEAPMEDVRKKIDNLIKENIRSNSAVVKKIEEMGPISKRLLRTYRGMNDNQGKHIGENQKG
jgi:hypothetical protein